MPHPATASFPETPSGTFLRDDNSWQPAGGGSTPTGTGFRHVTAGVEDSAAVEIFSGLAKISVGAVAPVGPGTGDLWVDTA